MTERSSSFNQMPIHKYIPMEKLHLLQANEVRILYYVNPSRFYVYLPPKIQYHAQFQMELQDSMKNYLSPSSLPNYQRYQPIAVQDNHAVWHRAMILDVHWSSMEVTIYFVDVGQDEKVSLQNIRPLPSEFIRQPAFAIPCRLFEILPLNPPEWKMDDPVHNQFNQLLSADAFCHVRDVQKEICYDVQIEIPKVGDLGNYLLEEKLVTSIHMRANTFSNNHSQVSGRVPPGFSDMPQLIPNRVLQSSTGQRSPSTPTSTESFTSSSSSLDIATLPAQDGFYIITHVYSATEFYGYSQVREKELEALQKHLEPIYNHEQSFSVHLPMEGTPCAILYNDKYHRVKIKQRVSDTRVSVKFVDRGDEILVDTSELLQLEKQLISIPAFAQRFRLNNSDELLNITSSTSKLKRLILNQRVHVTIQPSMNKEFYLVELKLSNQQSVNQLLLSNDPLPVILPPPPPVRPVEVLTMRPLLATEELPPPPNLLTNRSTPPTRSPQLQSEEDRSRSTIIGSRPPTRGFSTERNVDPYRTGRTNEENNPPRSDGFQNIRRDRNGFSSERNSQDNNRQGATGFTNTRTNNFGGRSEFGNQRNNDNPAGQRTEAAPERRGWNRFGNERNNDENPAQRTGEFHQNRAEGFPDRQRGPSGYRGGDRNDEENNSQRSGGFYNNRGNRNGDFQDRNSRFRNNQDGENDTGSRFANRGDRGGGRGFQNYQNREEGGGFSRRGTFPDRGRGFGARGDNHYNNRFRDRNENNREPQTENNEPLPTFSGWPNVKRTNLSFESADQYTDAPIPTDTFEFVISHMEHNNDFFIQLYSKEKELTNLTDGLQKEYKDAPEINLASMKINQACLGKSSDNCWYRATLLSTDIRKTHVRFIDFGDTIELASGTIRQLAKKFSTQPPYAYRCMLKHVRTNSSLPTNTIINRCAGQRFHGRIEKKTSEDIYLLQSKDLQSLMIDIKAIEKIPSCLIVYVDSDQHQFFIQDDPDTMEKIKAEVDVDIDLPQEDIQVDTMAISTFEDAPYRAIIQEDLDDDVRVYFVDYGNINICSKKSLKKCPDQLKNYPHQAKRCQLSPISNQDLDQAYQQLEDHIESEEVTYTIVKKTDDVFEVLLYIDGECWNEKFVNEHSFETDEQSSTTTTATTVKERERPVSANGKRNNEEIFSPTDTSINQSNNVKRQKSHSEVNPTEYRQGTLTYIDRNKPIVGVQLSPESEPILERIDELIDTLLEENQRLSSYNIGDHVIAQFSKDQNYYRGRIESSSTNPDLYTVYFLDYGNTEENIRKDQLYSYSDALKSIPPLAEKYSLDGISLSSWINHARSIVDKYENEKIEFCFIDASKSIIHLKFDNEHEIYNQPKTFTANVSGTYKDCFYIHILPESDALICEIDELIQTEMKKEHVQDDQPWNIDDLCIVYDSERDDHLRGRILSINGEKYNVQCIDYGHVLLDLSSTNLYRLINDELREKEALARACRLYGVDADDQIKAIDEVIRHINPMEHVTITIDNHQNPPCLFVMLFRENNEIVNDRFIRETDLDPKTAVSANSSDSAIAADDDTSNEQQTASPIGAPQAESTHQFSDTTNLTVNTINQTIDFGENDPSSSNTTIKDDHEN